LPLWFEEGSEQSAIGGERRTRTNSRMVGSPPSGEPLKTKTQGVKVVVPSVAVAVPLPMLADPQRSIAAAISTWLLEMASRSQFEAASGANLKWSSKSNRIRDARVRWGTAVRRWISIAPGA